MGDQEQFVKAILLALTNDKVIEKFQEVITSPLDIEVKKVQDSNEKIITQVSTLKDANNELRKEIAYLKKKVEEKDAKIIALEDKVNELEKKYDEMEQYSRRNSIRIKGLPERKDEDLLERFKYLTSNRLNVECDDMDVDRIHRVGPAKPETTRDVLVKLTTYRAKQMIYKARSSLRKPAEPPDVIDPEYDTEEERKKEREYQNDLSQRGIFINEDLTKFRSNLLWKARQMKRDKRLNDCWSYDGRIVVKNFQNKITTIFTEFDLNQAL
jgi:exosome complex exonuclease DIS3/RRP44